MIRIWHDEDSDAQPTTHRNRNALTPVHTRRDHTGENEVMFDLLELLQLADMQLMEVANMQLPPSLLSSQSRPRSRSKRKRKKPRDLSPRKRATLRSMR